MKYVIISDIHANLEALVSVLSKIRADETSERVICLGDIVGYGANPSECIKETKKIADVILAGNHDYAACDKTSIANFNQYARKAALWTRNELTESELNFLRELPLKHEENNLTFVHSSLHRPAEWRYILSRRDAYIDFQVMENKILFVGHSHVPVIFEEEGREINILQRRNVELNNELKYIINPGSVGQPRDRNPDASYAIFDSKKLTVEFRRVPYSIEKAQEKIRVNGLPEILAERLSVGR